MIPHPFVPVHLPPKPSCLCLLSYRCVIPTDGKGHPLAAPPLIREIAKHPVLSRMHLIAEPWDLGMYQVGEGGARVLCWV